MRLCIIKTHIIVLGSDADLEYYADTAVQVKVVMLTVIRSGKRMTTLSCGAELDGQKVHEEWREVKIRC